MHTSSTSSRSAENAPRLSIIVATWNAAKTLERCLQSIIGQEFAQWELLISDGASTDGTVDLIREHELHIDWWQSQRDGGIYDAWNQSLKHARGEYVCFLGADDAWIDTQILGRIFAKVGNERYDLVTSRGLMLDPSTGRTSSWGSAWDYRRIGRYMVVCHPGLLHRRSLFEQYGTFDTRYRIAGDLDFLLRLPPNIRTLHFDVTSVLVEAAGVSRRNVLARLREQREVLSACERYGSFRAYVAWADKLWRYPIAKLLNISH